MSFVQNAWILNKTPGHKTHFNTNTHTCTLACSRLLAYSVLIDDQGNAFIRAFIGVSKLLNTASLSS